MGALRNGHLWLNPEDNTLYGRDTADDEWVAIGVMGGTDTLPDVTDGTTTVAGPSSISFPAGTVTDDSGAAVVAAPTLAEVLAEGADAGGLSLTNVGSVSGGVGVELSLIGNPSESDGTANLTLGNDGFVYATSGSFTGPGPLVALSGDGKVTYSRAAFVANGSTVDQLRDSLIAAGLMDPS